MSSHLVPRIVACYSKLLRLSEEKEQKKFENTGIVQKGRRHRIRAAIGRAARWRPGDGWVILRLMVFSLIPNCYFRII